MPSNGLRKSTVKAPPLGELSRRVLYAFHVLPPSRVARTLAILAPPVAIQAFLPTLCCDASTTRREGEFSRQCRRHVVTDILPGRSVGCAYVREHSIHRVAVCDAPVRRPEGEAVIEGIRIVVLELHCPSHTAVLGLVDAKIRWVARSSNRHQVSDASAEGLHIAELQCFGAWNYTSSPGLSAVSGNGESAGATGCPDHFWIHWPDRDQTVGGAAVLPSECWLMN